MMIIIRDSLVIAIYEKQVVVNGRGVYRGET